MKKCVDFFPETPEGFHLRVEETLISLEEREMKNVKTYSRRMVVLVAAALVFIFAATAVAVVQGNTLRSRMDSAGSKEIAALVQDVHASDAEGDFSFSIDEVLWEGENMYVSYTAGVPDDGNIYLFSPTKIKLDGESVNRDFGVDAEFFASLFALGGEYGTSVSQIMQITVPEELVGEHQFSCSCLFMQAERPLEQVEGEAFNQLFTEPDAYGNENQTLKNADILYYTNTADEGDSVPVIYLHYYPEIRAVMDVNSRVTADTLESTGIARHVNTREITFAIRKPENKTIIFNDVAQRIFDMDGYSIEITELNLSHFNMNFEALIRRDDGEITEWTGDEPYGRWYFLCNADGSDIGTRDAWCMGGGMIELMDSGEKVYRVDGNTQGIYPVDTITEVYLAPGIYDENGEFIGYDMVRAIRLNPIYNPDALESAPETKPDPAETDDLSS